MGTTIATNALLERVDEEGNSPNTALITTSGFRDLLQIGIPSFFLIERKSEQT